MQLSAVSGPYKALGDPGGTWWPSPKCVLCLRSLYAENRDLLHFPFKAELHLAFYAPC